MSIIPQLSVAFILSLILSNKWFRGKMVLRNLYYFPNLVTPVTIGLLFGAMFSYPGGAVNNVITMLGLEAVDFQNHRMLARVGTASAIVSKNFGVTINFFTGGANSYPVEMMEAREVGGARALENSQGVRRPVVSGSPCVVLG